MTSTSLRKYVRHIDITVIDGPTIRDDFDRVATVTGLGLVFVDASLDVVRFETADDRSAGYMSVGDLAKPDDWPEWLRTAVEKFRPASEADAPAAEPRECRTCGEPAGAAGRIEHRPGTPCATDYRPI
jgi:hypothetical protein